MAINKYVTKDIHLKNLPFFFLIQQERLPQHHLNFYIQGWGGKKKKSQAATFEK